MESRECAFEAAYAADSKKASDVVIQDIEALSDVCDYFVLATGNNDRQVEAIADEVCERLAEQGVKPLGIEGKDDAAWVLIDFGSVIVHIFQPDVRDYYRLETLWGDAPFVDFESAQEATAV